ncbi:MAG: CHAT domain-containing protein [Pseudomonadales bacterium]
MVSVSFRVIRFPFVFLTALALSGCFTIVPDYGRAELGARYGEMNELLEKRVSDLQTASNLELGSLCRSYGYLKDYARLMPCLDEAEHRIDSGANIKIVVAGIPSGDLRFDAYQTRAQAYLELADYDGATEYATKVLTETAVGLPQRSFKIEGLRVLGTANAARGDIAAARANLAELEALSTFYPYTLLATPKANAMGTVAMAIGDYEKALETMEHMRTNRMFQALTTTAVAAVMQIGDLFSMQELPRAYMYGKALLETGDHDAARNSFDKLLKLEKIESNGSIYWMLLADRARIAESDGEIDLAIEFYARSIDQIEAHRSTINTEVGKIGFVGNKSATYDQLITLLFNSERYAEAFEFVERAKARALVDTLASRQTFNRGGNETDQAQLVAMLTAAESRLAVQDERATGEALSRERAVVVELKQRVSRTDKQLASLVSVAPVGAIDIERNLARGETLIEYYGDDAVLYAFVVNSNSVMGVSLDGAGITDLIRSYREQVLDRDSSTHLSSARALYDKLFAPLVPLLGTTNVTIVGHGVLHYLPFYALHDGRNYLIERFNLRMLPSASVLTFLDTERTPRSQDLLAFGNPDLGNSDYDLPGAQAEVAAIAQVRAGARTFVRRQATETALKQYGSEFNYLHFATHGTFDASAPLSSGLLLAKDSQNDGLLTVGELYDLYLPAELVTLSACETALGQVTSGDDVVGFTRGFLFAGVRSIVSSLWTVDDRATALLMQHFYENLATHSKRDALRLAMLQVQRGYNTHPYYWAAFQVTGVGD